MVRRFDPDGQKAYPMIRSGVFGFGVGIGTAIGLCIRDRQPTGLQ
jgi:hypothetical protein